MAIWADAASIDLSAIIRPRDGIVIGQASAEPQTLVEALVAQRGALGGCKVFLGINASGIIKPAHSDHLQLTAYCGAGHNRALAAAGVLGICPHPYSRLGALIRERRIPSDVVFVQVSPPNEAGEYSLGLAAEYLIPALNAARTVVAEVNRQVPWVYGSRTLHESDIALALNSDRTLAELPSPSPTDIELRIARHAAPFVPDGATIETGLGVLPDVVLGSLTGHRDLGVHSGALGDAVVDLVRRGIVTNARKSLDAGRCVAGLLLGTRILREFAHKNEAMWLASSDYTHAPRILATLDRFVAINSAVEVDLTGQVNAEIAGGTYVGAVGGALDFVRAANQSSGGVSLTTLASSVKGKSSRIVSRLSGPVATPRSEAGIIITEWGAADLRGLSLGERARRMIAIADPLFREELEREAQESGLLAA